MHLLASPQYLHDIVHLKRAYTKSGAVCLLLIVPDADHSSVAGRGSHLVAYPEILHCLTALGCDRSQATTPLGKSAGSLQPSEPHPAHRNTSLPKESFMCTVVDKIFIPHTYTGICNRRLATLHFSDVLLLSGYAVWSIQHVVPASRALHSLSPDIERTSAHPYVCPHSRRWGCVGLGTLPAVLIRP